MLLGEIRNQNYFQFDKAYYKPNKDIAMSSPISDLAAEIHIQHFEDNTIKHWIETGEIICYN
jgi:hypothetical protein